MPFNDLANAFVRPVGDGGRITFGSMSDGVVGVLGPHAEMVGSSSSGGRTSLLVDRRLSW